MHLRVLQSHLRVSQSHEMHLRVLQSPWVPRKFAQLSTISEYVYTVMFLCVCVCVLAVGTSCTNGCEVRTRPSTILKYVFCTGWWRLIGCLKLQVIFRKRATNYRALLRKMTCEYKTSYDSPPPCNARIDIYTRTYTVYIFCTYNVYTVCLYGYIHKHTHAH